MDAHTLAALGWVVGFGIFYGLVCLAYFAQAYRERQAWAENARYDADRRWESARAAWASLDQDVIR